MTREQLEHIIRACVDITKQCDIMIMGPQSILGTYPNPPADFTASMEADVYPLCAPHLAEHIEGAIGEFSDFHMANDYYAEGIDSELPLRAPCCRRWRRSERLL